MWFASDVAASPMVPIGINVISAILPFSSSTVIVGLAANVMVWPCSFCMLGGMASVTTKLLGVAPLAIPASTAPPCGDGGGGDGGGGGAGGTLGGGDAWRSSGASSGGSKAEAREAERAVEEEEAG